MDEFEQVLNTIKLGEAMTLSAQETITRFPDVVAHIIASSLGYATPTRAANILADALAGRRNYCEWISACFAGDPRPAVLQAIEGRDYHRGFMSSYEQARQLVDQALESGEEPMFASWF